MKKSVPFILLLSTLIFPVYYLICCIKNNYLPVKVIIVYPLIFFFVSVLIVIVKKIPFRIKLIMSCTAVFLSIILILVNYAVFYPPLRLDITIGEDALLKSGETFFQEIENYKSAEYYFIDLGSLVMYQQTDTLIIEFNEDDFSETVEDTKEYFKIYETSEESENSPEFDCFGFDFYAVKNDDYPFLHYDYPIVISFIGINYDTKEIAYVQTSDPRNGHSGTFESIFCDKCQWENIDAYRQGGIFNLILYRLS